MPDQETTISLDDQLGAIYDKNTTDDAVVDQNGVGAENLTPDPEATEGAVTPEQTPERDENGRFKAKEGSDGPPPSTDQADGEGEGEEGVGVGGSPDAGAAPSHLPQDIQSEWENIPEKSQKVIAERWQDMSAKLANADQRDRAVGPIYDQVLVAAKRFPAMQSMTPAQIGDRMLNLYAPIDAMAARSPEQAVMALAQQLGITDRMAGLFTQQQQPAPNAQPGQPNAAPAPAAGQDLPVDQLLGMISDLQGQIANMQQQQAASPGVNDQVQEALDRQRTEATVVDFAATHEHFSTVEPIMEGLINQVLSTNPEMPDDKVLETAYSMAVRAMGLKVAPEQGEPGRTETAKRASKSNIQGHSTPAPAAQTLDDKLSAIYDKNHGAAA